MNTAMYQKHVYYNHVIVIHYVRFENAIFKIVFFPGPRELSEIELLVMWYPNSAVNVGVNVMFKLVIFA